MKKRLDLQLFAEETAATETTATETVTEESSTTEPAAKPETEKKYTEAEFNAKFDKLFNQKYAELEQKKQKELDEAKKLAKMNAEEKADYALKQEKEAHAATQKELDEYKLKDTLAEMSKTARTMLAEEGINISDDLLSRIVTTDAEETKTAVDSFAKLFKDAVEKQVKDTIRGETPKTGTGSAAPISEFDKRIKKYE